MIVLPGGISIASIRVAAGRVDTVNHLLEELTMELQQQLRELQWEYLIGILCGDDLQLNYPREKNLQIEGEYTEDICGKSIQLVILILWINTIGNDIYYKYNIKMIKSMISFLIIGRAH